MLKVRNLSILHQAGAELVDISFQAGRGEVVAIIGDQNSGTSALLGAISNPDADYTGDVTVSHYKAKVEPNKARRLIGALNQPFEPPLHLTGYEYLELIGSFYELLPEERAERIIQLAASLHCNDSLYTTMERLPAATKHKIGLLASLICSPSVIIWDEPLLFLDPTDQRAIRELTVSMKKDSTTIIIASNNLEFVQEMADSIIVLHGGKLVAQGTLTELAHLAQTEKKLSVLYHQLISRA